MKKQAYWNAKIEAALGTEANKERLTFTPKIIWLAPNELARSVRKTRFIEVKGS